MPALARLIFAALLSLGSLFSQAESADNAKPRVTLHTSKGDIVLELYPQKAPVTVANFMNYARSGHYHGTIFHRVLKRFVIQAGGFDEDLIEKDAGEPIVNEAKSSGLDNERWTVAMARTADPDSARAQFFINLRMNLALDARAGKAGYAVFGKVIEGQHVARDIANSKVENIGSFEGVPVEPILINRVTISEGK